MNYDDWKTDPDYEEDRARILRERGERAAALAEERLQQWKDGEIAIGGKYRGER